MTCTGVNDDIFSLIYESNRINSVAVQTPYGLSRREDFKEIVMQGDVLAPLIYSLQVDTFGKECMEEKKQLLYYKDNGNGHSIYETYVTWNWYSC